MSSEPNNRLDNMLNHGRTGGFSFCEIIDLALPQWRLVPNEPSSLRTSKSSEGDREALPAPARYPNASGVKLTQIVPTARWLGNENYRPALFVPRVAAGVSDRWDIALAVIDIFVGRLRDPGA